MSWRHAEVLLAKLKDRYRGDFRRYSKESICRDYDNENMVSDLVLRREFIQDDHNLAVLANVENSAFSDSGRKGVFSGGVLGSILVRQGYPYSFDENIGTTVLFLMLAELWEQEPVLRKVYRRTDLRMAYRSGSYRFMRTAEEDLLLKLRLHFGEGSREQLDFRAQEHIGYTPSQAAWTLGDIPSATFWSTHIRQMQPSACRALRESPPRNVRVELDGNHPIVLWEKPESAEWLGGLRGYRILRGVDGASPEVVVDRTAGTDSAWTDTTAPGGEHFWVVQALYDDSLYASPISNRAELTVGRTGPDLTAGSMSVDDSSPEEGGSITLSGTVTNSGDAVSAATTLRYYRSSDATISSSDAVVGTDDVDALAAGGTSAQSVDLTAPPSAGSYYYGACVDAVASESNTSNNCSASVRVDVREPPRPPVPITVSFANLPEIHDGQTAFTFELRFSVEPNVSYRTVRDGLFDVTNGRVTQARRVTQGSNLAFVVTVQPSAASDISLTVRETTDCAAQYAVCTEDGRMLAGGTSATVAMTDLIMTVADTEVEEAEGATLDFTVTLSRASAQQIDVSYRSYDGTAKAGADYEAVSSHFSLAPGETTKTVPVVVLDDAENEDPETVNFWLWGVRGISVVQMTDPYAVGTIHDSRSSPDLEVGASVDDSSPEEGGSITLSGTVTNSGDAVSAATTLRYYRSSDATISSSDAVVGTDDVDALAAGGTSAQSVDLTAPPSAGSYYYGACVDAVASESNTSNNCSASVRVDVREPPRPPVPITVSFANLPEIHDGQTAFTFELRFSVEPNVSYRTVRDGLFDVTNGRVTQARRVTQGSNLAFVVTVQPSAASDISLTVRETTDCAAQYAVCTEDGRMLAGGTSATVGGT